MLNQAIGAANQQQNISQGIPQGQNIPQGIVKGIVETPQQLQYRLHNEFKDMLHHIKYLQFTNRQNHYNYGTEFIDKLKNLKVTGTTSQGKPYTEKVLSNPNMENLGPATSMGKLILKHDKLNEFSIQNYNDLYQKVKNTSSKTEDDLKLLGINMHLKDDPNVNIKQNYDKLLDFVNVNNIILPRFEIEPIMMV